MKPISFKPLFPLGVIFCFFIPKVLAQNPPLGMKMTQEGDNFKLFSNENLRQKKLQLPSGKLIDFPFSMSVKGVYEPEGIIVVTDSSKKIGAIDLEKNTVLKINNLAVLYPIENAACGGLLWVRQDYTSNNNTIPNSKLLESVDKRRYEWGGWNVLNFMGLKHDIVNEAFDFPFYIDEKGIGFPTINGKMAIWKKGELLTEPIFWQTGRLENGWIIAKDDDNIAHVFEHETMQEIAKLRAYAVHNIGSKHIAGRMLSYQWKIISLDTLEAPIIWGPENNLQIIDLENRFSDWSNFKKIIAKVPDGLSPEQRKLMIEHFFLLELSNLSYPWAEENDILSSHFYYSNDYKMSVPPLNQNMEIPHTIDSEIQKATFYSPKAEYPTDGGDYFSFIYEGQSVIYAKKTGNSSKWVLSHFRDVLGIQNTEYEKGNKTLTLFGQLVRQKLNDKERLYFKGENDLQLGAECSKAILVQKDGGCTVRLSSPRLISLTKNEFESLRPK